MLHRIAGTLVLIALFCPIAVFAQNLPAIEKATYETQTGDATNQQQPIFSVNVVGEVPKRPKPLFPLYVSFVGLTAGDTFLTFWSVRHGATEMNPAMQPMVHNPYAWIGIKTATTAATILLTESEWSEHPKRAVWTMVGINIGMGLIVWHNTGVAADIGPNR